MSSPIIVGDNVTIGAYAVVFQGVTIGNNSIIAAGAVVSKNTVIGENEIWGGVPAKFIKKISAKILSRRIKNENTGDGRCGIYRGKSGSLSVGGRACCGQSG
ncbi:MAG: hypothetical protein H6857_00745 [Rhodospirillales bacterium]|nr:hypothetical protein [Rhodospirillales bacterium]